MVRAIEHIINIKSKTLDILSLAVADSMVPTKNAIIKTTNK